MVWLATLSTVLGIATGMFTLRDEVLPSERGSAAALSIPAYQQQVGRVCDELNADELLRARETKALPTRLKRARTTLAQRNALLDAVRKTTSRSEHALAAFSALEAPRALLAARRATVRGWNRNLTRVRDYAVRLDRARTRAHLLAAIDFLSNIRTELAQDSVKLTSGLDRLGGASCELRTPIVTPAFTLPLLRHDASRPTREASTPPSHKGASAPPGDDPSSSGSATAGTPRATRPQTSAPGGSDATPPRLAEPVPGGRDASTPRPASGAPPSVR